MPRFNGTGVLTVAGESTSVVYRLETGIVRNAMDGAGTVLPADLSVVRRSWDAGSATLTLEDGVSIGIVINALPVSGPAPFQISGVAIDASGKTVDIFR